MVTRLISWICVVAIFTLPGGGAFAESKYSVAASVTQDLIGQSSVSEFVYKNDADEILIGVYLLGAINKPGIYHLPQKTGLISLLALSGGPYRDAEIDEITIKHQTPKGKTEISKVDLNQIVSRANGIDPELMNNDVILVKAKEPLVSSNTIAVVGLISGVVGIILSGFAITQWSKK